MAKSKFRGLRLGDVLQIRTAKGYVYAICTHRDEIHGPLIRVSSLFHKRPLVKISPIEWNVLLFSIFIIWGNYIDDNQITIVDSCKIPKHLLELPVFKAGIANPSTKRVQDWWLWDGKKEWYVGTLNEEECNYPLREMWDDKLLIDRIESNWSTIDA